MEYSEEGLSALNQTVNWKWTKAGIGVKWMYPKQFESQRKAEESHWRQKEEFFHLLWYSEIGKNSYV